MQARSVLAGEHALIERPVEDKASQDSRESSSDANCESSEATASTPTCLRNLVATMSHLRSGLSLLMDLYLQTLMIPNIRPAQSVRPALAWSLPTTVCTSVSEAVYLFTCGKYLVDAEQFLRSGSLTGKPVY